MPRNGRCRSPSGSSAVQSFREILPGDKDEALVFEKLLEFWTADEIEIILAPFGTPVGMIGGGTLHLGVVVGEMDYQLVGARR
jgi:hypothetical protein